MGLRGRRNIVAKAGKIDLFERPSPPEMLSEGARPVWAETVTSEASGHFQRAGMQHLLAIYCELVASRVAFQRELAAMPSGAETLRDRVALTKLLGELAGRIASLATKIKVTPASRERVQVDDAPSSGSAYDAPLYAV